MDEKDLEAIFLEDSNSTVVLGLGMPAGDIQDLGDKGEVEEFRR